MPEKTNRAREIAEEARNIALSLQITTAVQSLLLETTFKVLLEKKILSKADLEQIFYHCYATTIRTADQSSLLDNTIPNAMLKILTDVASGAFQIDLEALARKFPPREN